MNEPHLSIALLHYSAPPDAGGVETVPAYDARLMAAVGQDVCIVAGRGEQACQPVCPCRVPAVGRHVPPAREALTAGLDSE